MNRYGIIFILASILLLSACHNREAFTTSTQELMSQPSEQRLKESSDTTVKDEEILYENDVVIVKNTSISKTSAKKISRILDSLNVQKFKTFQVKKQSESGFEIEVTDALDYVYYFTLDKKGVLKTVYRNSLEGQEIYNEKIHEKQSAILKNSSIEPLTAWAIAERLDYLNVQEIEEFVIEEKTEFGGYCIRLTDILGDFYYLIIDRYGVLVRVHKDNWDNEPIYYIIE